MSFFIYCDSYGDISLRTNESMLLDRVEDCLKEIIDQFIKHGNYDRAGEYITMLHDLKAANEERKEYLKKQEEKDDTH